MKTMELRPRKAIDWRKLHIGEILPTSDTRLSQQRQTLDGTFQVERIIWRSNHVKEKLYLVQWSDYHLWEATWEPKDHLPAHLIQDYHQAPVSADRLRGAATALEDAFQARLKSSLCPVLLCFPLDIYRLLHSSMYLRDVLSWWQILTSLGRGVCMVVDIPLLENQPLGIILMCKQLCHEVFGCQTGFYDTYSLRCQIGGLQNHSLNNRNGIHMFTLTRAGTFAEGNLTCPVGSMRMKTKAAIIQCIKYERKKHHQVYKTSTIMSREDVGLSDVKYELCKKLYQSCENGNMMLVKPLLYKLGKTAGRNGSLTTLVQYVLDSKCDQSMPNTSKSTLLHNASYLDFINIVRCALLKSEVSIDAQDSSGSTPIMLATKTLNMDLFKLLLKVGSSLTIKDNFNRSILHIAAQYAAVKKIVSSGSIGINTRTRKGWTPIMSAVAYGRINAFHYLQARGFDATCVDNFNRSILHIAVQYGNLAAVKEIVSNGSIGINTKTRKGWTPIMSAVAYGRITAFRYLHARGFDATRVDKKGRNVLHLAALKNRVKFAKYILSHHIVDKESTDYSGQTALMIAASEGHYPVFMCLIQAKCSTMGADNNGDTALHMACKGGSIDIVTALLDYYHVHAFEMINEEGKTPLDMVDRNRSKRLFDFVSQLIKTNKD